ncbi:MAG: hypothetical protein KC621_27545 [Myxococcales bacterium]|nr:hypothetical protein [Myxococcales bacterium]
MLIALLGCAPTLLDANPGGGEGPTGPELRLIGPSLGSYLPAGSTAVTGVAREIDAVALNGEPVTPSGGLVTTQRELDVGLNTFLLTGTDPDGVAQRDMLAVLAGTFAAPEGLVSDAIRVHLSTEGLAATGPLVADLLDPAELNAELAANNPVYDDPTTRVELGELTFAEPEIAIVPAAGYLRLSVGLPDFVLPIDATLKDALPFGIDLEIGADIESQVRLELEVWARPDEQGGVRTHVAVTEVALDDFDLDTGLLELIDWMFIDDDDLADMIEDSLGSELGPMIDAMIAETTTGLGDPVEADLLDQTAVIAPWVDAIDIDPGGVALTLAMALDIDGPAPPGDGHVHFRAPDPTTGGEVHVTVSDDFMNRALHELWASGGLDGDKELDPATLFLFGGTGSGRMRTRSALPPVWLERDGEARLQLGEIAVEVDTPGGQYGEHLELVMSLDARAELVFDGVVAGVALSRGEVVMRLAGASVGNEPLAAKLDQLQTAFGLAIGTMNEDLQAPLSDLLGEGVVLPALSFGRDPGHLGTTLDLTMAEVMAILEATDPTPPPPPNDVVVPGTATVLDDDAELSTDGDEGWICRRDDVVTTGDGGTWYVSEDASLRIEGSGHVVWAEDDAEIVLVGPGNTVYADPGARIDDREGSNTVILVDPLTLDTSAAPQPGCT